MLRYLWILLLTTLVIYAAETSSTVTQRRPSRSPKDLSSVSTSSSDSNISLSSSSESEKRDHYSGTLSEDDEEESDDRRCKSCCGPVGGCGKTLSLRHSPGKTGILMVTDVALMLAFTIPLMLINSRFLRSCGSHLNSNDLTTVAQCYPDVYTSLVASIAAVEPLHMVVDMALFAYGIVYAMFGSKKADPDHWDGLIAISALLILLARIFGTIGTVFMLPGQAASNTTTAVSFQSSLATACGTFIGLESSFLLLMLFSFSRELYRRFENLSTSSP